MRRAWAMLGAAALIGCGEPRPAGEDPTGGSTVGDATGADDGVDDGGDSTTGEQLDVGGGGPELPVGCNGDHDNCELVDILFVIDNSGTMGEEQLNLAANFPRLVERLQGLEVGGLPVATDVNIMVTTTDLGHPLCTGVQPPGYTPAQGRPVFTGCNDRIESFDSADPLDPTSLPEACTSVCPEDVEPGGDPFLHFDPDGSNVTFNDIEGALACIGPQGINGCGYEAPLEAMLQALRPEACWNDPEASGCSDDDDWSWVGRGFLRPGSTLAIAIITDEADCSVASPGGFAAFTDSNAPDYWLDHPDSGAPSPSSAVCWRAGVQCEAGEEDTYASCSAVDNGVLHPTQRYVDFLAFLEQEMFVDVVMLGVLGVPPVTEHSEVPPFEPIAGGVADLAYRDWRDDDVLPGDARAGVTAAHKQWELGIGPGCTGTAADGSNTGQATPPVRILEVCESLDQEALDGSTKVRCCVESVCDDDFSAAIDCLTGAIADTFNPTP